MAVTDYMRAVELDPKDKRIQEDLEEVFLEQERDSPREYAK